MKIQLVQPDRFDDILFEGRNVQYGAYQLRLTYPTRIVQATIASILAFLSIMLFAFYSRSEISNSVPDWMSGQTKLSDVPEFISPPPAPKPPDSKITSAIASVSTADPNKVVEDQKDPTPTNDPLANPEAIPGNQPTEGTPTPGNDTPTDLPSGNGGNASPVPAIPVPDDNKIVEFPDQEAEFPLGGKQGIPSFIRKHFHIPSSILGSKLEGKIWIQFIVDKEGKISDIRIIRGISHASSLLNEEAIRVIQMMPKWKPAIKDGKPVVSRYIQSLNIRLE